MEALPLPSQVRSDHRLPVSVSLLLLALLGSLAGSAQATPSILAILPPEGHRNNGLPVLSADGSTLLHRTLVTDPTTSSTGAGVYLWTRESGSVDLADFGAEAPDASGFDPAALSGDGSRIVGTLDGSAVVWERGVGTTPLPFLPSGTGGSRANGISDDGRYVVGSSHDGGTWELIRSVPGGGFDVVELPRLVPVRWDLETGEVVALSTLRGEALDVSDDGTTVGELAIELPGLIDQSAAFRWDALRGPQYVPIGLAAGLFRWTHDVAGISADGRTIVGTNRDESPPGYFGSFLETAYAWRGDPGDGDYLPESGLTMLDVPVPAYGIATVTVRGVSADGSTIVGRYNPGGPGRGLFIWTPAGGFQDLEVFLAAAGVSLAGWSMVDVWDVSADGRTLVGTGRLAGLATTSSRVAWIAVIPEPSTGLLLGLGLALLARSQRPCNRVDVDSGSRRPDASATRPDPRAADE